MLKPLSLHKVRLIGLKSSQEEALKCWQKLGVLHITEIQTARLGLTDGRALESYDAVSEQLVRLRAMKNSLIKVPVHPAPIEGDVLAAARTVQIEKPLLAMREEKERLGKERSGLEAQEKALSRLVGFDLDFSALPPNLDYHLFSVKADQFTKLKKDWESHSWHSEWLTADDASKKEAILCLVATPKGVDCAAALAGVEKLELPEAHGVPARALLHLNAKKAEVESGLRKLQAKLHEMSEHYYPLIARLEETLTIAADMAQTGARLGNSADCFYLEGWVKPDDVARLHEKSLQTLGSRCMVREVEAREHHGEDMPTVLENPEIAGPFQFLVEFLSLPKADELDPSFILLFTIPILYGMIVGDAGYALLSLLLAWLLTRVAKKKEMLWQFSRVWMLGAIPSFIFGVLFDEYFGYSHAKLLPLVGLPATPLYHAVFSRVHDVQTLLLVSIFAGIFHVGLGLVLGIINAWNHERKHAYAKMGWLLVEAGGIFVVAHFLLGAFSSELGLAGALVMATGSAVIVFTEGPIGLIEIPGLASNIMSYCRIAAVGVGGLILADIINEMLAPDPKMLATPGGALTFAAIALAYVLAHVANTGLAMFESFIHGARLNVVEFFGKFYQGGGKPFKPFAAAREYTVENSYS